MSEYILTEIFIYPIKSAAGIPVESVIVEERGPRLDRRWMLTDYDGNFLTQRTHPGLALISVEISEDGLIVHHKKRNYGNHFIPFDIDEENETTVMIWKNKCKAVLVSNASDCWFSKALDFPCRLVYMPETIKRLVDIRYSTGKEITGFADAYPFLLIGKPSLADLNSRIHEALPVNRFRPNLVFNGGNPYDEDKWKRFEIGTVSFSPVKPCARCSVITINQETGIQGKEPLASLASFRKFGNKVLFGQNLIHNGSGEIKTGDGLRIIE